MSAIQDAAYRFIDALPQDVLDNDVTPVLEADGGPMLTPHGVEVVATHMQDFIANVIATLLNAGSERDAVNEDEALYTALMTCLEDW